MWKGENENVGACYLISTCVVIISNFSFSGERARAPAHEIYYRCAARSLVISSSHSHHLNKFSTIWMGENPVCVCDFAESSPPRRQSIAHIRRGDKSDDYFIIYSIRWPPASLDLYFSYYALISAFIRLIAVIARARGVVFPFAFWCNYKLQCVIFLVLECNIVGRSPIIFKDRVARFALRD